jgi:hypothetical protein
MPGKFTPDTSTVHLSSLPLPDGAARDKTLQALKALLPTALDSATGGLQVAIVGFPATSETSGVAAASNNATSLKPSAGKVYAYQVFNAAAYPVYLKFYDKAGAPSPATDTPIWVVGVPAGGSVSLAPPTPLTFSTGIAYAVVKLIAVNDNTFLVAGDCVWSIQYA